MRATEATIRVLPAHQARWEDLQTVFGARGQARRCQCQRYKLAAKESFASFPEQERTDRLRQQTQCGNPSADRTSGLVAYAGDRIGRRVVVSEEQPDRSAHEPECARPSGW